MLCGVVECLLELCGVVAALCVASTATILTQFSYLPFCISNLHFTHTNHRLQLLYCCATVAKVQCWFIRVRAQDVISKAGRQVVKEERLVLLHIFTTLLVMWKLNFLLQNRLGYNLM